ncbi:MAG: hypothetical protein INQ03_01095 [Candidatus Heimdallarchaeota archaeon]|nr:hypothetical protein [Candidatus Heimdallarchaeota archaeon]
MKKERYRIWKTRQVSSEEAQAKADEWGMPFFEASAKTNVNINELFEAMTTQLIAQ